MFRNFLSKLNAPVYLKQITGPMDLLLTTFNQNLAARKEAKLAAAHASLSKSVKELSEGSAKALALPASFTLRKWDSTNLDDLSLDQLEDLGRAHFEGIDEHLPKNVSRAVEVFKFASDRGSQTASYSYAACLKDGIGVEKDTSAAFTQLSSLANDKNYNLAHVSSSSGLDKSLSRTTHGMQLLT
jgi:TPR repeat protein